MKSLIGEIFELQELEAKFEHAFQLDNPDLDQFMLTLLNQDQPKNNLDINSDLLQN